MWRRSWPRWPTWWPSAKPETPGTGHDPDRHVNLPEARRTFKDVQVAHVGSTLPDGTPHVVPLWFVWLEDAVFVSCRAGSQVWRNLMNDPRVALQFDRGR